MRYEYMHGVMWLVEEGSAASKVCLGTMARQFRLCLGRGEWMLCLG